MSKENVDSTCVDNSAQCPICLKEFPQENIEEHANKCLFLNSMQENPIRIKRRSTSPAFASFSRMPHSSPKLSINQKSPRDIPSTNNVNGDKLTAPIFQKKAANIIEKKEEKIDTSFKIPLAIQVRPTSLDSFFGQSHVLGKNSIFRTLLEKGEIQNMILWGPPGCGKTSLSRVIQEMCKNNPTKLKFVSLCAASCGTKDVSNIIDLAKNDLKYGKRTVLFMDEIHRFNKKQQDVFLLSVEKGHIILIGATTENPSFALNSALLSRCRVIVLEKLLSDDLYSILENAAEKMDIDVIDESNLAGTFDDDSAGMGIEQKALEWLADISDGDARIALGNLQLALQSSANQKGKIINLKDVENEIKKSHMLYDKAGEEHYNIISAMHKSIRGSDANAALYWTTRMIVSGEDPRYIARRLVRAASEDIGNFFAFYLGECAINLLETLHNCFEYVWQRWCRLWCLNADFLLLILNLPLVFFKNRPIGFCKLLPHWQISKDFFLSKQKKLLGPACFKVGFVFVENLKMSKREKHPRKRFIKVKNWTDLVQNEPPVMQNLAEKKTIRLKKMKDLVESNNNDSCISSVNSVQMKTGGSTESKEESFILITNTSCKDTEEEPEEILGIEKPDTRPIRLKNLKQFVNRGEVTELAFYCNMKKCATCKNNLEEQDEAYLQWQCMHFCDTICLRTFQNQKLSTCCTSCYKELPDNLIGKYVFRFYKLAQFCSSECFEKYRRGRKSCVYCRSKILNLPFNYALNTKLYCSRECEIKHSRILNPSFPCNSKVICCVCKKVDNTVKIQFQVLDTLKNICSQTCFQTFVNQNELSAVQCASCKLFFDKNKSGTDNEGSTELTFCSKECKNFHIFKYLQITKCKTCGIRRCDADLIKRYSKYETDVFFCSIDCYIKSYPIFASVNNVSSRIPDENGVEQIQSYLNQLSSLSNHNKENTSPNNVKDTFSLEKNSLCNPCEQNSSNNTANVSNSNKKTKPVECFVIKEKQNPQQKNVSTSCKPETVEKNESCMLIGEGKEVQTEKRQQSTDFVVLPIPVNIPTPVAAFSTVSPKPVPFPVAVPVPLLVPLTKKTFGNLQLQEENEVLQLAEILTDSASIENEQQDQTKIDDEAEIDDFFEDMDIVEFTEEIVENKTSKMDPAIGMLAWNQWIETTKIFKELGLHNTNILNIVSEDLGKLMLAFVSEIKKPNGSEYAPDTVLYLCLSIQTYLNQNERQDNIFFNHHFEDFILKLDERIKQFPLMFIDSTYIVTRVSEDHLWESKQLGDHSPYVLLNTVLYHNIKYFGFTTLDSNLELFLPKIVQCKDTFKYFSGDTVIVLPTNNKIKKRCPSRLFKLYLTKLPKGSTFRNCYLKPELSCSLESPIWYTNEMISRDDLELMINRLKVVEEIASLC